MIHITNPTDTVQTYQDFSVPPGYSVLPGPASVVYLTPTGPVVETPDYLTSFGYGMLLVLPCVSILVVRRITGMLKPAVLDRYL